MLGHDLHLLDTRVVILLCSHKLAFVRDLGLGNGLMLCKHLVKHQSAHHRNALWVLHQA